jgi:hypothetical protein
MKTQQYGSPISELGNLSKSVRRPKATKAEAEAMDNEVVRIVGEIRSNWLHLGRLVQRFIETQAFRALGFPNMYAWMTSRLGESLSNAFSALRSVRALEGVPEEKLERIGERNANALTYLPEKERKSQEWLEKAATLPTKAFKQEVRTAIEKKTGLTSESFKTFSITLPEKVYESLCAAEKKIALVLAVDIETKPASRILVWEALAQWILLTDEDTITTQIEGR